MIYSGKKLVLEFFDKSLNGTMRGSFKFGKAIELDSDKRLKLGTQLKNFALKDETLSKLIKKNNGAVMIELILKDNSVTTLIDMRK